MIADLKKNTEQKMDKSVQAFKADLGKVRTGRAHTGLLDHVTVDYYGTPTPLNQVAKVILHRRAHHRRDAVREEARAGDREGDPRVRPGPQPGRPAATPIRVPMPALTEERRKELIKVVQARGRERARRGAQPAARRDPAAEGRAQEARGVRERRAPRARRDAEDDRPPHRGHRRLLQEKEKELMAV